MKSYSIIENAGWDFTEAFLLAAFVGSKRPPALPAQAEQAQCCQQDGGQNSQGYGEGKQGGVVRTGTHLCTHNATLSHMHLVSGVVYVP